MPGAIVGIIAAVDSRERSKRAQRRADRMQRAEVAAANEQAARERRSQLRQARIARAQVQNQAAAMSLQGSSAEIAGVAGVTQQSNVGIGDINRTQSYNTLISDLQSDIFKLTQPSDLQLAANAFTSAYNSIGNDQLNTQR